MRKLLFIFPLVVSCCTVSSLVKTPNPDKQNFIYDEYGRILIHHGVFISNSSKHSGSPSGFHNRMKADTSWISCQDVSKLSDWGFNLVRHAWHWEGIEPNQNNIDTSYVNRKLKRVQWFVQESLQVMIDLHQDLYCQRFCGNGFPDWMVRANGKTFDGCTDPWNKAYLDDAVLETWKNFWNNDTLQNEYIDLVDYVLSVVDTIPMVLGVEIMNEPFIDISFNTESKKLTKLYKKIYKMREEKGYSKYLFFEPWMGTSSGISSCLRRFGSNKVIYAPHYYDVQVDAGQPYGVANGLFMNRSIPAKVYEAQVFDCPIILGEFGATTNNTQYIKDLLNLCDKQRMGWCYYTYDKPDHSSFVFINDDGDLNEMGKVINRVYPQKIAGERPYWELKENKFKLEYIGIDIDAPTIIYYPKGMNITIITDGEYIIDGQMIIYKNTTNLKQSINILW